MRPFEISPDYEQAIHNAKQALDNLQMCAELVKLDNGLLKEQVARLEKEKGFLKDELKAVVKERDNLVQEMRLEMKPERFE